MIFWKTTLLAEETPMDSSYRDVDLALWHLRVGNRATYSGVRHEISGAELLYDSSDSTISNSCAAVFNLHQCP